MNCFIDLHEYYPGIIQIKCGKNDWKHVIVKIPKCLKCKS